MTASFHSPPATALPPPRRDDCPHWTQVNNFLYGIKSNTTYVAQQLSAHAATRPLGPVKQGRMQQDLRLVESSIDHIVAVLRDTLNLAKVAAWTLPASLPASPCVHHCHAHRSLARHGPRVPFVRSPRPPPHRHHSLRTPFGACWASARPGQRCVCVASGPQAGKAELHSEPLLVRDAVLRHMQTALSRNAKPGVELLVECGEALSAVGDPTKLRQIMHNLVSNALKFTARGYVKVRASRRAADDVLLLAVEDTGPATLCDTVCAVRTGHRDGAGREAPHVQNAECRRPCIRPQKGLAGPLGGGLACASNHHCRSRHITALLLMTVLTASCPCCTFCARWRRPGIPLEHQQRLFTKYEQLDRHRNQGTGIGLARPSRCTPIRVCGAVESVVRRAPRPDVQRTAGHATAPPCLADPRHATWRQTLAIHSLLAASRRRGSFASRLSAAPTWG